MTHAAVACIAVAATIVASNGALVGYAVAAAAAASRPTNQLLVQPLADIAGKEVRISLIESAPGSHGTAHRHPGAHTFGYVIEGTYEFGINNGPAQILKAGDTFYEPPGSIHSTSNNVSPDKPLKFIVFMISDKGAPTTVQEPPK
jgi:quercetin dioxygenase-like cupin family protein